MGRPIQGRVKIEQVIYDCIINSDANQSEIAAITGIHGSQISKFMGGTGSFSMTGLQAMCIYFDLELVKKEKKYKY